MPFSPLTRAWFDANFDAPTEVQRQGWESIASGEHSLLLAPTGSGKTLAAFLYAIDRLCQRDATDALGVRVLYISPLKALAYDVDRNLRGPLRGIEDMAAKRGERIHVPSIASRTGDTSAKARQRQIKHPGDILVTTPESLYLMLGSQVRATLRSVEFVIVDEVHALAPSKRGAHLALSLERLSALADNDPQRIGLSATAHPTSEVARFLGGDRPVRIIDASAAPLLDVNIVVPVADMTRPQEGQVARSEDDERPGEHGLWPAIYPRLVERIRAHRSTIVFVNSRGLCERLVEKLNELAAESGDTAPLARAHHGSVSHSERTLIEEELKAGNIPCLVATSSLELGIDMGAVDLVLLVESPPSVASALQRIGRAGHGVGERSKGYIFPKHRGDLLQAAVISRRMQDAAIESIRLPDNALDLLAQQIVAMVAVEDLAVEEIARLVRRAASYRKLPDSALYAVLDMLAGRYPSTAFADLRARIDWDRASNRLSARPGAKMLALVNGGTIPDRGMYAVHLGEGGPRLGELDEEMVHEMTPGHTFTLGASTWRIDQINRDRVVVSPAPGAAGRLPFWRGEGPGRPLELGRAIGALCRELAELDPDEAAARLEREHACDRFAAENLVSYLHDQLEATARVPSDRSIVVERYRDELGDWRLCVLSPFGARVHAPWALAIKTVLREQAGVDVAPLWTDDGIILRFGEGRSSESDLGWSKREHLVPDPDAIEELVTKALGDSALFASQFRENAARSLLMPRRRPGARTPLWLQRLKAQELLTAAREHPSFPVIMETYRSCLQDIFDLPALEEVLRQIRTKEIELCFANTNAPSPFARSLSLAYTGANLYEGDTPAAERRLQALQLDRGLLRELLGQGELRKLLDSEVIAQVQAELQHVAADRKAASPEALHDLLRRLGDLSRTELAARCTEGGASWLDELALSRRALSIHVADEERWIAAEDAALYRDALGCTLPVETPEVFLEPREHAIRELLYRYAKHQTPFTAEHIAKRYAITTEVCRAELEGLIARGLERGAFLPQGSGDEWCDGDILTRLKRRTLRRLRDEVAPVAPAVLARFSLAWHGIGNRSKGSARLEEIVEMLEGCPLPFSELESRILPARMQGFSPNLLDALGSQGAIAWVGCGALGATDGMVAVYRRHHLAEMLPPPELPPDLSTAAHKTLDVLAKRGASFLLDLVEALRTELSREEVNDALRELAWAGLATNDTFYPLREFARRRKRSSKPRKRSSMRIERLPVTSGRWTSIPTLVSATAAPTTRLHTQSVKLLERHGILSREVTAVESMPGGFAAYYPVLAALEEVGKARRGLFVESLSGAQFALPGAVDRLRSLRDGHAASELACLAATDPANPFGWLVPWPGGADTSGRARRAAGASVVICDGELVFFIERGGKRLLSYDAARDRQTLRRAVHALRQLAASRRGKYLRVEQIDAEPALRSPLSDALREAGFESDPRGLLLDGRTL